MKIKNETLYSFVASVGLTTGMLLTMALPSLAAAEIKATATPNRTVYAEIIFPGGNVYNGTATGEAEADADWAFYKVPLVEQGTSAVYVGNFPAVITAAGQYSVVIYEQQGTAPLISDTLLVSGTKEWSGTALATQAQTQAQATTAATQSAANGTQLNTVITGQATIQTALASLPNLAAIEAGIWAYTLPGSSMKAVNILNDLASVEFGTTNPTQAGLVQTSSFALGGTTFVTSVLTKNSSGNPTGKTVTLSNQQ